MYCPKCGSEGQESNTYCRACGGFLPDFENTGRKQKTPAEQFKLSLVFNLLSAVAGIGMAIALLVVFAGKGDTHPVIFSAVSLFLVISTWQIVSFFNNLKLRRRFVRESAVDFGTDIKKKVGAPDTKELLSEGDMSDFIPASVTEDSTKRLNEQIRVSADPHQKSD